MFCIKTSAITPVACSFDSIHCIPVGFILYFILLVAIGVHPKMISKYMYDKNSRNVKKNPPKFNDFGLFYSDVLKRQLKNVPWLYLYIWFFNISPILVTHDWFQWRFSLCVQKKFANKRRPGSLHVRYFCLYFVNKHLNLLNEMTLQS